LGRCDGIGGRVMIAYCLICGADLPEDHTDLNGIPKGPKCNQCEKEESEVE
jgi:hypothetical protein